jgi:HK97 family phage portal protein
MSLFFRSARTEERSITSVPFSVSDGVQTFTRGYRDSMHSAIRLAPLYACVGLITDAISTCPLAGYTNSGPGGGKQRPATALLDDPGVNGLDVTAWLSQCATSLLFRGNAIGVKAGFDASGVWPTKVQWLYPDHVEVDERGTRPVYRVGGETIPTDMIVHVRGMTLPGSIMGQSVVSLFRRQIETGLRVDKYKHDWYDNTSVPSGILQNTGRPLNAGEAQEAKARFKAAVENHDILATGNDWQWNSIGPTAADAEFLEATKATATTIASLFHISPEEVGGEVATSLTYKTLEANSVKFAQHAVMPWAVRIERALTALLPRPQYARFNLDSLVRVERGARMAADQIALVNGIQTLEEIRGAADSPPLTPDELDFWQKYYGAGSKPVPVIAAPVAPTATDPVDPGASDTAPEGNPIP